MENKIKLERIELRPLLEQLSILFDGGVDFIDITLNQETNIVHVGYKKEYLSTEKPNNGDFNNSISLN